MSDKTIPPTAACTIWIFTSSVASLLIPSRIASTEPFVSAFKIIFTVLSSPSWSNFIISDILDSTEKFELSWSLSLFLFSSAFALASFWFFTATNWSPAVGDSSHPIKSIGDPGTTSFCVLLLWSNIDFILQNACPAYKKSPCFNVPLVTITVATLPLPTSILDSTIYPDACVL